MPGKTDDNIFMARDRNYIRMAHLPLAINPDNNSRTSPH
jgi:hypothetical protein